MYYLGPTAGWVALRGERWLADLREDLLEEDVGGRREKCGAGCFRLQPLSVLRA